MTSDPAPLQDAVSAYRSSLLYALHMLEDLLNLTESLWETGTVPERPEGPPARGETAAVLENPAYRVAADRILRDAIASAYDGYGAYDVTPDRIDETHGMLKDAFWKLERLGDDWICIADDKADGRLDELCGCLSCTGAAAGESGHGEQPPARPQ